jgi:hypothetical protein
MSEVNRKLVCVCEHLFALPELPCFKAINDPLPDCPWDAGITYHCVSCVEEACTTGNMDLLHERLKTMCEDHYRSDAMMVMHTVDA